MAPRLPWSKNSHITNSICNQLVTRIERELPTPPLQNLHSDMSFAAACEQRRGGAGVGTLVKLHKWPRSAAFSRGPGRAPVAGPAAVNFRGARALRGRLMTHSQDRELETFLVYRRCSW